MADTVTISKEYFDKLLQRSEYAAEGKITIHQHEFDFLVKAARDYHKLRSALVAGGVETTALDILIDENVEDPTFSCENGSQGCSTSERHAPNWSAQAPPFVPREKHKIVGSIGSQLTTSSHHDDGQLRSSCNTDSNNFDELNYDDLSPGEMMDGSQQYEPAQSDANYEERSIVLKGISPFTSLADVLAVIRGGAVLNIYLRHRDRTAHVTYVESEAAEKFLIHSKRADVYVKGKRIEVFWDDHQHFLQDHLARRIHHNGATRNLFIRFVKPDMTEESLREDLDHIHRLEIVGVHFEFGHALIMLNSVQQAITARSCMSSRFKYKGTRITFAPDECAEPLPAYVKRDSLSRPTTQKTKKTTSTNRFASLSIDDENHSGIGFTSPVTA